MQDAMQVAVQCNPCTRDNAACLGFHSLGSLQPLQTDHLQRLVYQTDRL